MKSTEYLQQLAEQSQGDPVYSTVLDQLALITRLQDLLPEAMKEMTIPQHLEGEHSLEATEKRPNSTTGEVLFTMDGLALKVLNRISGVALKDTKDPNYFLENPTVRLMSVLGEALMAKLANKEGLTEFCRGIAGMPPTVAGSMAELRPLDLEKILTSEQIPVLVMQRMQGSLDKLLPEVENDAKLGETLVSMIGPVFSKVVASSIPLEPDRAYKTGSTAAIRRLLLEQTVRWLASRSEPDTRVFSAARFAQESLALTEQFFSLKDTTPKLEERAVGSRGEGKNRRIFQAHSVGDAKLSNILFADRNDLTQIAMSDAQWLTLRPFALGLGENPEFAPWPHADLMQIFAYTATQYLAYGIYKGVEALEKKLAQYYKPYGWDKWNRLYFKMLVVHKLNVDVAVNIDNYLMMVNGQIPHRPEVEFIVTKYPMLARNFAQNALAEYRASKAKTASA